MFKGKRWILGNFPSSPGRILAQYWWWTKGHKFQTCRVSVRHEPKECQSHSQLHARIIKKELTAQIFHLGNCVFQRLVLVSQRRSEKVSGKSFQEGSTWNCQCRLGIKWRGSLLHGRYHWSIHHWQQLSAFTIWDKDENWMGDWFLWTFTLSGCDITFTWILIPRNREDRWSLYLRKKR